jgi:hypothetical protein
MVRVNNPVQVVSMILNGVGTHVHEYLRVFIMISLHGIYRYVYMAYIDQCTLRTILTICLIHSPTSRIHPSQQLQITGLEHSI